MRFQELCIKRIVSCNFPDEIGSAFGIVGYNVIALMKLISESAYLATRGVDLAVFILWPHTPVKLFKLL